MFREIMICYLLIINIVTTVLYGWDKRCAMKGKYRISEKMLFGLAWIGGSVGAIIGMKVFRHKTRKMKFILGLPCILILHVAIIIGGFPMLYQ